MQKLYNRGRVAKQLEPWTCNSEAQNSSPALTACWVQILNYACK